MQQIPILQCPWPWERQKRRGRSQNFPITCCAWPKVSGEDGLRLVPTRTPWSHQATGIYLPVPPLRIHPALWTQARPCVLQCKSSQLPQPWEQIPWGHYQEPRILRIQEGVDSPQENKPVTWSLDQHNIFIHRLGLGSSSWGRSPGRQAGAKAKVLIYSMAALNCVVLAGERQPWVSTTRLSWVWTLS